MSVFITAIGNYAKGWYTEDGDAKDPFNDLKKIIGTISGTSPEYVSDKDVFNIVAKMYIQLIVSSKVNLEYCFSQTFTDALFPWFPDTKDVDAKLNVLNGMLSTIRQTDVAIFPDPNMPLHNDVLKIFPISDDKLSKKEKLATQLT